MDKELAFYWNLMGADLHFALYVKKNGFLILVSKAVVLNEHLPRPGIRTPVDTIRPFEPPDLIH